MTPAALRRVLVAGLREALEAVDLEQRVAAAMPRVPASARAAALVAMGKAAPAMARGALRAAGSRFAHVLVVAPDGTEAGLEGSRIEVLRAAHPDPDARSVAAARRALELVRAADFVVALVSGGASALVCLPEGMTLARYVRVVHALLVGGAGVREVNVVRRHMCAVKGGGLARAAGGPVRTLVASDVLGGAAGDVGSGPTLPDASTPAQARRILARYAPALALPPLRSTWNPRAHGGSVSRSARSLPRGRLVASPEDLARALASALRPHFRRVRVLRPSLAPVDALAREYLARAAALQHGEALVRAAEPSVVVDAPRPGRGGRSTHLAALVATHLPAGVALLAAASDGVDGSSCTGGALVDASRTALLPGPALLRALAGFDTGALLAAAGMALPLAPSGTNLADVHVLARA